jgi:hypothetical protein
METKGIRKHVITAERRDPAPAPAPRYTDWVEEFRSGEERRGMLDPRKRFEGLFRKPGVEIG